MKTQKHDLINLINKLEARLELAVVQADAFEQLAIYKQLDDAKSTLINISND